jgi:hypothetical protein
MMETRVPQPARQTSGLKYDEIYLKIQIDPKRTSWNCKFEATTSKTKMSKLLLLFVATTLCLTFSTGDNTDAWKRSEFCRHDVSSRYASETVRAYQLIHCHEFIRKRENLVTMSPLLKRSKKLSHDEMQNCSKWLRDEKKISEMTFMNNFNHYMELCEEHFDLDKTEL